MMETRDCGVLEDINLRPLDSLVANTELQDRFDGPTDCDGKLLVAPAGGYKRSAPLLLDDEDATAQARLTLAPVRLAKPQSYHDRWAVSLPGARMTGQGAVVTRSGGLIAESVLQFTANGRLPDGIIEVGGSYKLSPAARRVEPPCLLAKRPWYRNYGHWLVDCATVIGVASEYGLSDSVIVIGTYENPAMNSVVRDTIEALAPGREIMVHPDNEVWEFDHLRYVAPLHVPPFFKLPAALRCLRTRLLPSAARRIPTRRLFVSRGECGTRLLTNENELLGFCVKRGFELVYPERLSAAEQVMLFSEAQVVVGVKGAALTNAIFMSPGSTAIVLSPADFPDPFFWDICGQLGISYVEIFGPLTNARRPGRSDFTIRVDKMQVALSMIKSAAP